MASQLRSLVLGFVAKRLLLVSEILLTVWQVAPGWEWLGWLEQRLGCAFRSAFGGFHIAFSRRFFFISRPFD